MSVKVNENGYVEQAFFTEVKAVRVSKTSTGSYVFIVFGEDGSDECFEIKSKVPKQFPIFVQHERTEAK